MLFSLRDPEKNLWSLRNFVSWCAWICLFRCQRCFRGFSEIWCSQILCDIILQWTSQRSPGLVVSLFYGVAAQKTYMIWTKGPQRNMDKSLNKHSLTNIFSFLISSEGKFSRWMHLVVAVGVLAGMENLTTILEIRHQKERRHKSDATNRKHT